MADQEDRPANLRKGLLYPIIVSIIGVLFGAWFAYYIERGEIGYIQEEDLVFRKAQSVKVDKNLHDLNIDIGNIKYLKDDYDSILVKRYRIKNESKISIIEGVQFYILGDDKPLPEDSIIDITWGVQEKNQEIISASMLPFDRKLGHSFKITSSFPGEAEFRIFVLLDESKLPPNAKDNILIFKIPRSKEKWTGPLSPSPKIVISYGQLVLFLALAAALYGLLWLSISILRGNYSTGMELIDSVWYRLFHRKIFKDDKKETK